jgi:hypothetical protein
MLLMLLTGQRIFAAIGGVAALFALLLWGEGGIEMPFNASFVLLNTGVPYFTVRGLIQGPPLPDNAFAIVEVHQDWSLGITGFGRAESKVFSSEAARRLLSERRNQVGTDFAFRNTSGRK